MKINLLLTTAILLTTLCVYSQEIKLKKTIVAGKITHWEETDPQVIAVNFCDPLNKENKVAERVNRTGTFVAEHHLYFAQNITISYAGKFINLYIRPGDSVHIEIDMNKFRNNDWSGLSFTGSESDINSQLYKLCNYLNAVKQPDLELNLPPKEFMAQFNKTVAVLTDSLTVYAHKEKLHPFLIKWAKRDIIYQLANSAMDYGHKEKEARLAVFTDPIFDIHNPENFKTMLFQYQLGVTLGAILNSDDQFTEYLNKHDIPNALKAGITRILEIQPSLCRDLMLYKFVEEAIDAEPDKIRELTANVFQDKFFNDKINQQMERSRNIMFPALPLDGISYLLPNHEIENIPEQDFMAFLANKYTNKVIYLDIYATWCSPCKAEFKAAKEIHKLYEDDNIVYVNLCLESNKEAWLATVVQHSVAGENYFFSTKDASELFRATYKVEGFPTYMILNKKGKIVEIKAPRPSNIAALTRLLDKYKNE